MSLSSSRPQMSTCLYVFLHKAISEHNLVWCIVLTSSINYKEQVWTQCKFLVYLNIHVECDAGTNYFDTHHRKFRNIMYYSDLLYCTLFSFAHLYIYCLGILSYNFSESMSE